MKSVNRHLEGSNFHSTVDMLSMEHETRTLFSEPHLPLFNGKVALIARKIAPERSLSMEPLEALLAVNLDYCLGTLSFDSSSAVSSIDFPSYPYLELELPLVGYDIYFRQQMPVRFSCSF